MEYPFVYGPRFVQYIIHLVLHNPRGGWHTGMGQVFTFAHDRVAKYCASQNATEQNRMQCFP